MKDNLKRVCERYKKESGIKKERNEKRKEKRWKERVS
jgi:hypothetical protein